MKLPLNHLATFGLCLALGLVTTNAAAQGFFDPDQRYYLTQSEWQMRMSMLRVVMIGGATGLGFAIGWFFSPAARELRAAIAVGAAVVACAVAVLNHGPLGWSLATLIAMIGFCYGVGYWFDQAVRRLGETPTTFGSAKWADAQHLAQKDIFGSSGILLGSYFDGQYWQKISYKGDRHAFTYAPTRSGKGVSHIIPNLLEYLGSVLVIDVKGENLLITGKARAEMGQEVLAFDPWNIAAEEAGFTPARFNFLDWIQLTDPNAPENAMVLAESFVVKNDKGDPFWQEEAKALVRGLILLVAFDITYHDKRHMGTVRDLLLLTGDDQTSLFEYMANSPHALIASTGARFLQKDDKLLSSVMASAQAETHFLDSERVRDAISTSDFDFADLKTKAMSVYLIIPADRVEAFSRLLRAMVQQSITVNARNIGEKPETPVLFILDEMPSLGRLASVEQAYGLMAGFGMQIWGIAQDLCQMRRVYGEDYESFIANSGVVAYFGSPDERSTEYFSKLCGVTTVWNFSSALASAFSSSSGAGGGSSSTSNTNTDTRAATQRKLIFADELRRLDDDLQLILIENANPIMARKIRWFEDPDLKDKGVNLHDAA
ncbi:type IV secretory system conjugative DNA transfer family protein [uncultured Tateyamaria sp.]|uniref:type IV secretory system conjugative DNA transfer family protein n=1 Tax=uncultured Tateyamaria sp. TaxID=455651 RepID=UPI00262F0EBD|nr:type IV secretory system conjugative DNA transfer family protein [uncultured Tateyamaria sp.]